MQNPSSPYGKNKDKNRSQYEIQLDLEYNTVNSIKFDRICNALF